MRTEVKLVLRHLRVILVMAVILWCSLVPMLNTVANGMANKVNIQNVTCGVVSNKKMLVRDATLFREGTTDYKLFVTVEYMPIGGTENKTKIRTVNVSREVYDAYEVGDSIDFEQYA